MMSSSLYTGIGYEIDKDAAWDYIRNGYLLGPRTVLRGRVKNPQFIRPLKIDLESVSSYVRKSIESSMGQMAGAHRAVMFTGGFDSLLICKLAQRCGAVVKAITVRFDEFNPRTVQGAVDAAQEAGFDHHILDVKVTEFLSAFEELAGLTDEPLLSLDLAVVYAALGKYDHRIAGNVFISGMGSDQWFGDMALEDWPGGLEARLDWAIIDEAAHQKVAKAHGRRFIFPFLTNEMLAISQSIPPSMKKDKNMLRAMAVVNKIPSRGARTEIQIPNLMRRLILKVYGDRAWPHPVTVADYYNKVGDQTLRQIILGLWLEKRKEKMIV